MRKHVLCPLSDIQRFSFWSYVVIDVFGQMKTKLKSYFGTALLPIFPGLVTVQPCTVDLIL